MALSELFSLEMQNNGFEGVIPDFVQKGLKVNFADNTLSGHIPPGLRNQDPSVFAGVITDDAFEGMSWLRRVDLKNNKFIGGIPGSLTALSELFSLEMQNNGFEGVIPDFVQKGLKVNFADNTLSGLYSDQDQDPSVFAGNNVCGPPFTNPCKSFKKITILKLKD
ncbi:pollen receptor-like kinase 4 [Tanacetum coccineum]